MKNKYNNLFPILFILVTSLAVVLRLYQLGSVPVSFSDDETRLVYNAYSIWTTGRDLNGIHLPIIFPMSGYAFNPVPIYLTSPFVGFLGLTMFTGRLPFAIAGIATVIAIYFLAVKLTASKLTGLLSAFVLAISPWHLQISRIAYEGTLALFFYTLGVLLFIHIKKNGHLYLILSLISFLIGFYSYSGYKLILLPIVITLAWFHYKNLSPRQIIIISLSTLLIYASFWYLGKAQNAFSYGSSPFFFGDLASVEKEVELERRESEAPELFKRLYHNKLTVLGKSFIGQYVYALSPQHLFTSQEGSGIFSIWFRGQLYYHEAILIFIGLLYMFIKFRRTWMFILMMLFISPLPAGLGPPPITYTIRSSFILPWLAIFIGSGIAVIFRQKSRFKYLSTLGVLAIYIYYFGGYITQYYYDYARYGAKYYSYSDKSLSDFLTSNKTSYQTLATYGVFETTFLNYSFYNRVHPDLLQKNYLTEIYTDGNISLHQKCIELDEDIALLKQKQNSLIILFRDCFATNQGAKWLQKRIPDHIIYSLDQIPDWYVYKI